MILLGANGLGKSFGANELFSDLSFSVETGEKIGLVGSNGCGKTTLFRILTRRETEGAGEITCAKGLKIAYMEQSAQLSGTVYEECIGCFSDLLELERQIEEVNLQIGSDPSERLIQRQHELQERFLRDGGAEFRSRTKGVLNGLGFSDREFDARDLSGGQKTRLMLAKILLSRADLLLLDEPTNHLDITSVEWLERYLKEYGGAFLVISHDRYFLDQVTQKTWSMANGTVKCYPGNYSRFLELKELEQKSVTRAYENTQKEIHRIEGIIAQQRQWNRERNIRTAEHKQKSIDRLKEGLEAPEAAQKKIRLSFAVANGGPQEFLTVRGCGKQFGERRVFGQVDLDLRKGDRAFLLGGNGCGKTTLLKRLLGELDGEGEIRFGPGVTVGYYDQMQDTLPPDKTVLETLWDRYPAKTKTELCNALAAFLFFGDDVESTVGVLSGGERARLLLCRLMLSGANLLLLDEPTNHLDIASREALEQALAEYEGTYLIVSHDRYFINRLATKIYELTPQGAVKYDGDYEEYQARRRVHEEASAPAAQKGADYRAEKERKAQVRRAQSRLTKCEEEIARAERELGELRVQADAAAADYNKSMELYSAIREAEEGLERLLEQWEQFSEELEQIQ